MAVRKVEFFHFNLKCLHCCLKRTSPRGDVDLSRVSETIFPGAIIITFRALFFFDLFFFV